VTRDDACTIVAMVVHGWPGPAWEAERLEAYVDSIMPLDAVICTHALARARNALKYRPAVSEIREFYQIERRLSEADEARLVLPDKPNQPAWVGRWERARAAGDMRPFPEQMAAFDALARQDAEHYKVYRPPEFPVTDPEHWIQPEEYTAPTDEPEAAGDEPIGVPGGLLELDGGETT
jgi:hypothetical protein